MSGNRLSRIEALLNQLQLSEPSTNLDEFVLTHSLDSKSDHVPTGFSWMVLASTALAASLVGLFVGFTNSQDRVPRQELTQIALHNVADTESFNTYHGHSGHPDFQQCSICHEFSNKQVQVIEKWQPHGNEGELDGARLPNCSLCHVKCFEQQSVGRPSDLPTEIRDLETADQISRHLGFAEWTDCASCHQGDEPLAEMSIPRS